MAKRREGDPFMAAPDYGRSLAGFNVNLLVKDVRRALDFQEAVLGLTPVYWDSDFAVMQHGAVQWMLHADHTYDKHPLSPLLGDGAVRGLGCELRLYDIDPDVAEARARARGYAVLQASADKPHGLREVFLLDADNYLWVPGRKIGTK
jgi:catechol 2,3-dioxygenase-like lactoylglutathione lyase family enzyme